MQMRVIIASVLVACASTRPAEVPRQTEPLAFTYLGVAGWQIDSANTTILVDPYFSRPSLDGVITSDPRAVAARAPKRADVILIGHSHVDHLLDAPAVALATGAQIIGSDSTARVARAAGVPSDRVMPVKGGEDYAFDRFSIRVLPSLHSVIDKHALGAPITVVPPKTFDDYQEGGTFNYLVRLAGRQIFVSSTANFIERELVGIRADVAIVAPGLRHEIYDYTCRLLTVLGKPPLVYVTHFDNWRGPPVDEPPTADLTAFIAEVRACSPGTRVVIPKHFERMQLP